MTSEPVLEGGRRYGDDPHCILVWPWRYAPEELRTLSRHYGGEEWVAWVPKGLDPPWWADSGTPFGRCETSEHEVDGGVVLIGSRT